MTFRYRYAQWDQHTILLVMKNLHHAMHTGVEVDNVHSSGTPVVVVTVVQTKQQGMFHLH